VTLFILLTYIVLDMIRPEVWLPELPFSIMTWTAVAAAVLCAVLAPFREKRPLQPATVFLAGFAVVATVSSVLANGFSESTSDAVLGVLKIVVVYVVLTTVVDSPSKLFIVRWTVIGTICLLALGGVLYGFFQYRVEGFSWDNELRLQYSGIYKDSNDLGQLFTIAWGFLIFDLANREGWLRRIPVVSLLGLIGWAIFLTASRGAILGAGVGVLLAFRKKIGIVVPGIILLAGLAAMNQFGVARMDKLSVGEASAEGRIKSWAQGWYMLRAHPLVGVGPLNYKDYHGTAAHSSLVQIAAENGLAGMFCWLGFFFYPLREVVRGWRKNSAEVPFVTEQLQTALAVCFFTGLFLSRGYVMMPYLFAGLTMVAINISASEKASEESTEVEKEPVEVEAEAEEASPELVPRLSWIGFKHIAAAQLVALILWRYFIRNYVDGI
jgi:putative inorganic carbon (HCO3(-)) transporter